MNLTGNELQLVAKLHHWRMLECECCGNLLAMQNRASGALRCLEDVVKGSVAMVAEPRGVTPTMVTSSALNAIQQDAIDGRPMLAPETKAVSTATVRASIPEPKIIATPAAVPAPMKTVALAAPAAVPAPVKIAAPVAVPAPVKTEAASAKASAPEPVKTVAPAVPAPTKAPSMPVVTAAPKLFANMKYSENVIKQASSVKVHFAWGPTRYTVGADADEAAVLALQEEVAKYAAQATPGCKPVMDEIVIAKYEDAFYRARVVKINGSEIGVVFIDFGDSITCSANEIYPVNSAIYNYPVYGMIVTLRMPQALDVSGLEMKSEYEDLIYEDSLLIEMNKKLAPPQPGTGEPQVKLWRLDRTFNLNDKLFEAITLAKK